ncbi:hypothetical protein ACHAWF_001900 [Thalassiosira exigua]
MLSIIAISSLRRAAISHARTVAQRHLSFACAQSVDKLNEILEEYRAKNYTQTFPKRFHKDVVHAASVKSLTLDTPAVTAEGIEHVLHNIGMADRMSRSEIEDIVSEIGTCPIDDSGASNCHLSADQMLDLMSKNFK